MEHYAICSAKLVARYYCSKLWYSRHIGSQERGGQCIIFRILASILHVDGIYFKRKICTLHLWKNMPCSGFSLRHLGAVHNNADICL